MVYAFAQSGGAESFPSVFEDRKHRLGKISDIKPPKASVDFLAIEAIVTRAAGAGMARWS